ncbi:MULTISPECIES: histidine kinase [Limosilactobacillus]|nr:histidine kinase [Limosilactobacillus reuteri]MQB77502.1 histidine kinase [Limosilactobacillus reuteri]MQB99498.1 histidine kinase [Limosilactobacillus reuteri]MRI04307.1 histidine kinase [Limosilactobacillus reuteri]
MSFSIHMASDEQLDSLLRSNKRIPAWRLSNTQSEREHKRIHQLQVHNQQLKQEKQLIIMKRKKQQLLVKSNNEVKKPKINASHHTSSDELTL